MNETQAREAICQMGARLYQRGYLHGTVGNISIRLPDAVIITPTDACLGVLDPARLAKVSLNGEHLGGDRPSKTIALHQAIVAAARAFDPDTACVLHTHSHACVARSLLLCSQPQSTHMQAAVRIDAQIEPPDFLPPITPYFVMKVGHVPHIPYARPGAASVVQAVEAAITAHGQAGHPIRAVMLAKLGPTVWHSSPEATLAVLEELEETARLTLQVPQAEPLSDEAIEELRQAFGARW
ncbi:MAG: class II aldolase/adducin family protein [Burkholderiaceae bacterium]